VLTVETTEREVVLRLASTPGEFEAFVEGLRSDPAGAWEDHDVVALLVEPSHSVGRRHAGAPWALLANDDPAWASRGAPACWPLPDRPIEAIAARGELRLRPESEAA